MPKIKASLADRVYSALSQNMPDSEIIRRMYVTPNELAGYKAVRTRRVLDRLEDYFGGNSRGAYISRERVLDNLEVGEIEDFVDMLDKIHGINHVEDSDEKKLTKDEVREIVYSLKASGKSNEEVQNSSWLKGVPSMIVDDLRYPMYLNRKRGLYGVRLGDDSSFYF